MSVTNQQLAQAIQAIEEQLVILKQAIGQSNPSQEGVVGIFDGEFMVEDGGKRHQVPPNYASKTMLVPGDSVRMIEGKDGGQTRYKQIGKVERVKTHGVLVKKDGKYEVLTEEGSFKVLSAAIKHYNGEVGDQVFIQYPKQHPKGSWAAVEKVVNHHPGEASSTVLPAVQPVLAEESGPAPVVPQAMPVAHAPEQVVAPEVVAEAASSGSGATPNAPRSEEVKPAHSSKSKTKSTTNKPKKAGRSEGKSSLSRNKSAETTSKSAEPASSSVKPKATPEEATAAPAPIESAFGEDDLI